MIILASKSTTRQNLLRNAGVLFRTETSHVDEADDEHANRTPKAIAEILSAKKALAVGKHFPADLVIGCDQTMECSGEIILKPLTRKQAEHQLKTIRGTHHQLHSSIAIACQHKTIWRHTSTATLYVRNFSDGFADDYLDKLSKDALTSVGCYQLEEIGIQLFDRIDGDYHAILGLPLLPLLNYLRSGGHIAA
jgi:septum formation protein